MRNSEGKIRCKADISEMSRKSGMDTFVESYSFDGITVIPFCTSGSSSIERSEKNLSDNAGSGNWLDGQRFAAGASEADISSWIDSLQ